MPQEDHEQSHSKQEAHEERKLFGVRWGMGGGQSRTSCCGAGTHHLKIHLKVIPIGLIQPSAISAFLPTITAFLTRYLVNEDVVEVIGEAAREFVSQVRKQVLLLRHS